MKILNIVLSVLVLIMAAASAAAAFLLFSKRAQMVDGWSKLTTAIRQTAETMDRNSGTTVAKDLSVEALAHSNYENLDSTLGKLKTQAQQLVAERDALAGAIRRIGQAVNMKNLPESSALTGIATSNAATNDVINGVGDFRNRREKIISQVVSISRKVNAQVNANDLRDGDVDSAFRNLDSRITAIRAQFSAYQNSARQVGAITGAGSLNFSDSAYSSSLKKVTDSANALKSKLNAALRDASTTKRQLSDANNKIRQRDGQIATLNNTIARRDAKIVELKKALGLEPADDIKLWDAGSPDAQRMVMGKVIEVNRKFGFIAVNIGKNTVVKQPVGKKFADINPMLAPDMVMLVARDVDSPNVKYIGKVKLVTVDGDCSIAENVELAPEAEIKTGDSVFFPESKAVGK